MSDDQADAFDLSSLSDEELVQQVHDDLYNGLRDEVIEATNLFLGRGWGPDKVLNDALVEGMRIVGIDFRDGILFVPEVLLAANAMKAGMEIRGRCSPRPAQSRSARSSSAPSRATSTTSARTWCR